MNKGKGTKETKPISHVVFLLHLTPVPPPIAVMLRRWAEILRFTSTFTSDHFFYISECVLLQSHSVQCLTHTLPLTFFFLGGVFIPDKRLPNNTDLRVSTSFNRVSSSDSVKLRFFPLLMVWIWWCREGNPRCRPYLNEFAYLNGTWTGTKEKCLDPCIRTLWYISFLLCIREFLDSSVRHVSVGNPRKSQYMRPRVWHEQKPCKKTLWYCGTQIGGFHPQMQC